MCGDPGPCGQGEHPACVYLCVAGITEEDSSVCGSIAHYLKLNCFAATDHRLVCLFVTPAVRRAAWAHGVIDLLTRCFPRGRHVVARRFIFRCSR